MSEPENISSDFCRDVVSRVASGEPLRCELPQGGHLHIDRQLPFLCVYRKPPDREDSGTAQLLTSQAAYVLGAGDEQYGDDLNRLISAIAGAQAEVFGGFLLLEIWTGLAESHERAPVFRIRAPVSGAPAKLLEAIEGALLRVRVRYETPVIELEYSPAVGPPDKQPLLQEQQRGVGNVICLGLEISPFFRDSGSGELYVFTYKEFRDAFNRALKRCFYEFTHSFTNHRPAHFHELGPRAIDTAANAVDAQLAEISERFDLLLFVSPVNYPDAWEAFRQAGFDRSVEFLYRPRIIDPDLLKRELYGIPIESIEDPTLFHIFNAKREELDRQITLLSDRNTPRFLLGSRQLFGEVAPALLQIAQEVLEQISPGDDAPSAGETLNAEQFAAHAHAELEYYRQQDRALASQIHVRKDIPGIMVSKGDFLIGAGAEVSRSRIHAALAHEIGTHVVTYHNGRQQPFKELYIGMAGYEPLQEGLAVLSEYLVGELGAGRLRQLAGRVVAVHSVIEGADFIETFRLLHKQHGFGARSAFMTTMRSHRGGGYTKDSVYLEGLVGLLESLANGKELQTFYLGKIALEYLPLIEELRWRQVLRHAPLVPRVLAMPEARAKLQGLARGMTVTNLLGEGG